MTNQYLEEMLHELGLVTKKVQAEFGRLSVEQLNWKPAADSCSIAQCLAHLITTTRQYFPVYAAISSGQKKNIFWESLPFLPFCWAGLSARAPTRLR